MFYNILAHAILRYVYHMTETAQAIEGTRYYY